MHDLWHTDAIEAWRALGSRDALLDLGAHFAGMAMPGGGGVKPIDKLSMKILGRCATRHARLCWRGRVYRIVTGARLSLLTRSTSSLNGSMPAS